MSKRKNIIKSILNGELKLLPVYTKTPFGDEKKFIKFTMTGVILLQLVFIEKAINLHTKKRLMNWTDFLTPFILFV